MTAIEKRKLLDLIDRLVRCDLLSEKDVDTELANIRKVTGESAEAIEKLGNEAYETASKYGVTATEFLSSASDFARAGYDNYSALLNSLALPVGGTVEGNGIIETVIGVAATGASLTVSNAVLEKIKRKETNQCRPHPQHDG